MSFKKFTTVLVISVVGLGALPSALAQTYTVLYSFTGKKDGIRPTGGLLRDVAGNLYGVTSSGGSGATAGSIFKLDRTGHLTVLHSFGNGGTGGALPSGALIQDAAGNLYGATAGGGSSTNPNCFAGGVSSPAQGCGTVFKLDTKGNFSVLYSFPGDSDCSRGCSPLAPLTLDRSGNLYGTTFLGGSNGCDSEKLNNLGGLENSNCGVVFKLDAAGKETALHRFSNGRKSGDFPNPALLIDSNGNLYGTTEGGGINTNGGNGGAGTIFKLDPAGNETVLHFFEEFADGDAPQSGLIQDASGNFYGTTAYGGIGTASGSVFKLDPEGNLTQLLNISCCDGGEWPFGGVTMDAAGNLYGTTADGGNSSSNCDFEGCGVIFKLDTAGIQTVLHSFTGKSDGGSPRASMIMDPDGNLYGMTPTGGVKNKACPVGCGVVFKIRP